MENSAVQENLAAHGDQRVGIFIDTQNLYHSAKSLHRSNVNYEAMIMTAVAGRKLMRAFAYVIKSEEATEEKFFEALEQMGIEIRVKDLQVFHTGAKKADWDVGITVDIVRMVEKLDVVVLVSGDGDFLEVVRYCKSKGVRVEVVAFEKTSNAQLLEECDYFTNLSGEDNKYLISNRRNVVRKGRPAASGSGSSDRNYNKPAYQEESGAGSTSSYFRAAKAGTEVDEAIYKRRQPSKKNNWWSRS